MRVEIWLSLFGALVVGSPALAAPPPSDGDLARATKLYQQFDYVPALDLFQTLVDRTSARSADRATASIYVGLISQTLGDEGKSHAAFERAISLDRTVPAPPDCSPKVVQILDDLRRKAKGSGKPAPVASTSGTPQPASRSPWLPVGYTAVGLGGSGVVGGVMALVLSGSEPAGSARGHEYGNVGLGLLIGGGVVAGVGALVWALSGHSAQSAPRAEGDEFAFVF